MFTVDATSGALVAQPAFTEDLNWSGGIHMRADGSLVGVSWVASGGDDGVEALFAIDPATAETTLVAEIPGLRWVLASVNAYNPAADHIHIVGASDDAAGFRIYTIDAGSGELVSDPVLDTPSAEHAYNWSGGLHLR